MNRLNYLLTLSALFLFQPLYASSEGDADYAIAASLFLEVLNEGRIELVDDILAEEVLLQGKQMDRQRLKQIFKRTIARNYRREILYHVAGEGKVYLMMRVSKPWPDYAIPSDSNVTDTLVKHERLRLKDGKIIEIEFDESSLGQLKELSGFKGNFEEMVKALSSK